jgi:hypothetical protein
MNSIEGAIQKLEKEAAEKLTLANRLTQLKKQFPDLREVTGRWNKVVYASKQANDKVEAFEWRRNCGCCADSPIEVWFYLVTELGRVYSDPPMFFVGEQNPDTYRPEPRTGWDEDLIRAAIPERMIGEVKRGVFGLSEHDRDDDEL